MKTIRYAPIFAGIASLLFSIAGSIISIVRFWQYDAYYIDFGIFDQAIWKVSRFGAPVIEHFLVGGKWIFADHFNPSIFLLSPLYWLTNRSEIIFIAQAVAVGISGYILFRIARDVTHHDLWALTLLTCYFLFVGLQNAVITEFHELTVMTLALSMTWWAVVKKKTSLYFILLLITLGFKEALFPLGIGLGIAIFFLEEKWRKIAIVTMGISIIWGLVSIKVIVPYFSGGEYIYAPQFPSGIANTLGGFIDKPEKQRTLFYSFASFGFLPVFSVPFWVAILQDYGLRFLPVGFNTRWNLGLHYNAQSAVILFLSSIYSVQIFLKNTVFRKYSPYLCIGLVVLALYLNRFVLNGPFNLVYNPAFYEHTKDFAFLDDLVKRIPSNASVMTQNNIAGHFTHQDVYLLTPNYQFHNPDYIVFDLRDGQGTTNFFGIPKGHTPESILEAVRKDKHYYVVFRTQHQYVFQKTP
jgi:uncharacterized membrane protein